MQKVGVVREASAGDDLTALCGASGPWMDSSSIRRRRLSAPSSSALLTPAADACAVATIPYSSSSSSGGVRSGVPLDLGPPLHRYTRTGSYLPLSLSDSSDLYLTSTRRRLHRLLQRRSSASPLSPIDNLQPAKTPPPMYRTPVKLDVGENVVVMDGVLVSDAGSVTCRDPYKMEVCCTWNENVSCRSGSKCQFAHGKEELRRVHPVKHTSELTPRHSDQSQSAFCSIPSAVDLFAVAAAGGTISDVVSPPALVTMLSAESESKQVEFLDFSSPTSVESQKPDQEADEETTGNIAPYPMTSPLDAEIDKKLMFIPLPSPMSAMSTLKWPLTEAEDSLVTRVLYGPSRCRRLPVFTEFCSE